jgi:hypothetical protein
MFMSSRDSELGKLKVAYPPEVRVYQIPGTSTYGYGGVVRGEVSGFLWSRLYENNTVYMEIEIHRPTSSGRQ